MIITLQSFLRELTFIQIPDIKRHAKGLLTALEKSNRKEMLGYKIGTEENIIIPLYFREDEKGKKVYDEDSIREEFERKMKELPFNSRS